MVTAARLDGMKVDIVSVFPQYFEVLGFSLLGKAQHHGLLTVRTHDLRDWTHDVHRSVDDTPVGGGAGMVMKPEVWGACLDELLADELRGANAADNTTTATPARSVLIFPSPSAPLFTQRTATELSRVHRLVFACGRYEGYDARVPEYYRVHGIDTREYSIGDYVLNGGEAAVSVMLEAITRLLPGFMGNPESIVEESYTGRAPLLEHRQYTRPTVWRGLAVPQVLTGGDHGKVNRFRRNESLRRTAELRPDLIGGLDCDALSADDRRTLAHLGWHCEDGRPVREPARHDDAQDPIRK